MPVLHGEQMTPRRLRTSPLGRSVARLFAAALVWGSCLPAWPGPPPPVSLLDDHTLRRWTIEDGLPERAVQGISEGPLGYLWVATARHLLRFDGVRFVDVGSPGTDFENDAGERILQVHAASDGLVYVLTTEGVRCHGPDGWKLVRRRSPADDPNAWQAATLTGDTAGTVHLGHDGDVATFRGGTAAAPRPESAADQWTLIDGVPHAIIGGDLESRPIPDRDRSEPAIHLSISDGTPTVVTATSIHRWHGAAWEVVADRPPGVTCAIVDHAGAVWCGGEQGIRELRRGRWATLDTGAAPVNVSARMLLEDSGGTIWAATDGGLVRFRERTRGVRVVPVAGPIPGIRAAWQAEDSTLLAAPERGGLVQLRPAEWRLGFQPVTLPDAVAALRFEVILGDARGALWLGTDGAGLWHGRLDGGAFSRVPNAVGGRRLASVAALAGDPTGRLWIGGGEGLFILDPAGPPRLAAEPNDAGRLVEAIYPDDDGTLWIGRQGEPAAQVGAAGDTLRRLDIADLSPGTVWSFHRDRQGTLWAGGHGRLVRVTEPTAVFDTTHGLPETAITQLADAASGVLWVGTHDGLFAGDLGTIERSPTRRGLFRRFDPDGPLGHVTCTGRITAPRRSEEILFPTTQGLVVLDGDAEVVRRVAPQAIIEDLTATPRDGTVIAGTPGGMVVPAGETAVAVRFTALHLAAPEALRFRYRVTPGERPVESDQSDDDWTPVGRARRVVLRGLPAGRHIFEVRASLDGKYASEGATATLDVESLYWQRADVIAASGAASAAAVAAVILGLVRRRYRRRLARERELQGERERIARDIHDDLGAGLTQVAHLSAMAADHDQADADTRALFHRICTATTGLTRSLDEIVWAVNPANDSLDKLISYLAEFAQEFASAAGVACRLDLPQDVPHQVVPSRVRHNVCMLLKESLNNAVLHGAPSEVLVTMRVAGRTLRLTVLDDGQGFDSDSLATDASGRHSGIPTMRHRVGELGGMLTIESLPGSGTTVDITVEV
ncbi:MAG: ATP-binding protein [Planctomycetaceae bacterium]